MAANLGRVYVVPSTVFAGGGSLALSPAPYRWRPVALPVMLRRLDRCACQVASLTGH